MPAIRPAPAPPSPLSRHGWVVVFLLFFAAILNYVDRGSLSVAAPQLAPELQLDPVHVGLLLSAFFWSYSVCQMIAGWLVDRYPVYWVFAIGFLLWSVATLASGVVSTVGWLFALRLLLGIGESVAFPCYSKVITAQFPPERRGLPNALLDAGTKIGPSVGTFFGGLIAATYGWRAMFLVLGAGSLLWLVPWLIVAPRPSTERAALRDRGPGVSAILKRREAWGMFLGTFCYTYGYFFLLTWLPSYLVNERHVSLAMMGVLGALPFLFAAAAAVICGWASDEWIRRGGSPTLVRKTFIVVGLLGSTTMVPAVLVHDLTLSMILLCTAYVAYGVYASNQWAIAQTLAGSAAVGTWSGIQNTFGSIAGIIAPIVTGFLVASTGTYFLAFLSPAIIAIIGVGAYLILVGPVAPLRWSERDYI